MAENEPGQDPRLPEDARLNSLEQRLKAARLTEAKRTERRHWNAAGFVRSPEWRILSVLVGYPVGSALIGLAIDRFAGTSGIWVVMLFVGFGIAVWEIWKISQRARK